MRRAVTLVVALATIALCAALIVREVALAAGQAPPWQVADLWHDLLTAPRGAAATAGVVVVVGGVLCLWLALGMLGGGRAGEGAAVELGDLQASVIVKSAALEHLLAHRLVAELPEVTGAQVRVTHGDDGVAAHTSLSLVATDVRQIFARARTVVERELRTATGLDAGELTVEVDELLAGRGGVT